MKKSARKRIGMLVVLLPLCWFFPKVFLPLVCCGIYDVVRNRKLTASVVNQYFFGNGMFTWLLSPFNICLDLLAFPYVNKGIYGLEDLPRPYRREIQRLIETAHTENLVARLEERTRSVPRSMVFFKWYGDNVDTFVDVPAFHEKYRFIKTIGVSVFNKRESTSRHFGPLRATLRVLYNINNIEDRSAYIEVGDTKHYWCENKLFIFDDTLLHQSFNESDGARYCLFVDILRPSLVPPVLAGIVSGIRFLMKGMNSVFYKNWKVLKAG